MSVLGRETFLAPVEWSADGWPVIGDRGRLQTAMQGALPLPHPWPPADPRDDFESGVLGLPWNTLRNAPSEAWSLDSRLMIPTPSRQGGWR